MRILDADLRQPLFLAGSLTAEQIYALASPAVFFVEVFDKDGASVKSGSGFFISDSGLAATNYHVVTGAHSMKITTDDGDVLDVLGVYDYSWKNDLALIQIDIKNCPYLELADSSKILTGATIYTLGSPLGLYATFSRGIVSQAIREIDGVEFIQLDAPISSGSSGGALLDSSGRGIGITSATAVEGQNINLAMPINLINSLSRESYTPLKSILIETAYYANYFPAPDFGAFFGVKAFNTETRAASVTYSYLLSELKGNADGIIGEYTHLVEQNLFVHTSYLTRDGVEYKVYYNAYHDVMLTLGKDKVKGRDCFTVMVS
jgi:S1-C subfamily serine protease